VLPSLGSFESDRPSPGDGIVLPGAMLEQSYLASLVTFVGIDLAPGVDPGAARSSFRRSYEAWGVNEFRVDTDEPVRPAEIIDAQSVRAIPLLVGGLLGLSLVVGLGAVVTASVRARRRELAMLRTLGFTGRQLRTSVRVQALVTMLAALAIGVPLGIAAGRVSWRAFANGLAVVLPPSTPAIAVLAIASSALVAVLLVATVPAIWAGRGHPAVTLRSE
jgi:FtsX-like permease family